MRTARIWGRDLEMVGGPYTFVVWERERGGDFLAALSDVQRRERVTVSDYLPFAWAMCATADDGTPGYDEWCRSPEWSAFDLSEQGAGDVIAVISSALVAEFFPSAKAGRGPRARIRRLVRRAARRLRRA